MLQQYDFSNQHQNFRSFELIFAHTIMYFYENEDIFPLWNGNLKWENPLALILKSEFPTLKSEK